MNIEKLLQKEPSEKKEAVDKMYTEKIHRPVKDFLKACSDVINNDTHYYRCFEKLESHKSKKSAVDFLLVLSCCTVFFLWRPEFSKHGEAMEVLNMASVFLSVIVGLFTGIIVGEILGFFYEAKLASSSLKEKTENKDIALDSASHKLNNAPLRLRGVTNHQLEHVYNSLFSNDMVLNYLKTEIGEMVRKLENAKRLHLVERYKNSLTILNTQTPFSKLSNEDLFWLFKAAFGSIGKLPYEIQLIILSNYKETA